MLMKTKIKILSYACNMLAFCRSELCLNLKNPPKYNPSALFCEWHCVKSVHIRSYSGPYAVKYEPE